MAAGERRGQTVTRGAKRSVMTSTPELPDNRRARAARVLAWGGILFRPTRLLRWFCPAGLDSWYRRTRWRRVVVATVGLGCAGIVSAVSLVFVTARYYAGNESVRFVDVALPWRWANYEIARGDAYIRAANRCVKEQKFAEALSLAARGVGRSPANRGGRLMLAELYLGMRRPEQTRRVLLEGLPYHSADPVFLKPLLDFLMQRQEDRVIVGLARRYFARISGNSEATRMWAQAAATVSYFCGDYDQAEDFLQHEPSLAKSTAGRLLASKIDYDRGYPELGLMRLRLLAAEAPRQAEIQGELIHRLRRQGLHDEARRVALALQIAQPGLAGPRLELLAAYRHAGDVARLGAEIESMLRDFPADSAAMLLLADFAANSGDPALVARIERLAGDRRLPTEAYGYLAVEAAIVARDYTRALAGIRELQQRGSEEVGRRSVLNSLQAIAHYGVGEVLEARVFLSAYLVEPDVRVENLLAVANRLAELNAGELARQTLSRAIEIDPANQAALMRLIEFDLTLERVAELPAHVTRYLQMRRPSGELLRVVQHKMGSDHYLFSREAASALKAVHETLASQQRFARR